MDSQHRLTRWSEWELGACYCSRKGTQTGDPVKLIAINVYPQQELRFLNAEGQVYSEFNWRNRYTKYTP